MIPEKRQNWKIAKTKTKKLQKFKDAKIDKIFDKKMFQEQKSNIRCPNPVQKHRKTCYES